MIRKLASGEYRHSRKVPIAPLLGAQYIVTARNTAWRSA
jgi:hypothetical protein